MGRVHNLDIYPCDGTRWCVGCVTVPDDPESLDHAEAPARAHQDASYRARPEPISRARTAAFPPPPAVVLAARWTDAGDPTHSADVDLVAPHTEVRLRASTHGVSDGTSASFEIRLRPGRLVASLEAPVGSGLVGVTWMARNPGTYSFEVNVAGASAASSSELLVEAPRAPLKLCHIGRTLRTLLASSRVIARWYLEDLSYEHLCALAELGASDPENDPLHMPRALCLLPGMEGEDVREAQGALTSLGHGVTQTGVFDSETKAAFLAWLPSVQPEGDLPSRATIRQVPPRSTFAALCSENGISDWTDLWIDHGSGAEDDPDLPGSRRFRVPARSQRREGHTLLESTGRDTPPAYGGTRYVSPVVAFTRALTSSHGELADLLPGQVVELRATRMGALRAEGPRAVGRFPRRTVVHLVVRQPLERVPESLLAGETHAD